MKLLNGHDLRELIEHGPASCVSMYLPTHRGSREQQQDAVRLKNLIGEAIRRLIAAGLRPPQAEAVMEPLERLREDVEFWRSRSKGMASFCAVDFHRFFHLPLPVDELLIVNSRFHIKPLLPLLRSDAQFYVLALTQSDARLFEATRYSIRELALTVAESNGTQIAGKPAQPRDSKSSSDGNGSVDLSYDVHRRSINSTKTDILHYFQHVDRRVVQMLRGQRAPLVLACVGYLAPIYESANSYPNLLKVKIPGSPERWELGELRHHAWQLVEPYFRQRQQQALRRLQSGQQHAQVSDDVREVILAAMAGRVDTLFVEQGAHRWGRVEPEMQAVHFCDGAEDADEELLDYAVACTLGNGGDVFMMDALPQSDSPIAATFRY